MGIRHAVYTGLGFLGVGAALWAGAEINQSYRTREEKYKAQQEAQERADAAAKRAADAEAAKNAKASPGFADIGSYLGERRAEQLRLGKQIDARAQKINGKLGEGLDVATGALENSREVNETLDRAYIERRNEFTEWEQNFRDYKKDLEDDGRLNRVETEEPTAEDGPGDDGSTGGD